jgi:hypothetical protein
MLVGGVDVIVMRDAVGKGHRQQGSEEASRRWGIMETGAFTERPHRTRPFSFYEIKEIYDVMERLSC